MKQLLLASLLCSLLAAETSVSKSQEFKTTLTPDKLSTILSINVIKKDYVQAANTLSSLATTLKKYESICKSGDFSITKATQWDNVKKKSVFMGYQGFITLECEYGSPDEIEKVYNDETLKAMMKESKNTTVNNRGTRWIVSNEAYNKTQEELEVKALTFASPYAKKLSTLLNKECKTKDIRLASTDTKPVVTAKSMPMMMRAESDTINASNPSKKDVSVNYSASYIFTCN